MFWPLRIFAFFLLFSSCASSKHLSYPDHWWQPIHNAQAPDWEILPDQGQRGKTVILSKRHELGVLSNFAPTPFELDGKRYASVEGLWQASKYPDPDMPKDPRRACPEFKHTRAQVEQMASFEAKKAGDPGSACMKRLTIDWVSYKGRKMPYRAADKGEYYQLIYRAMKQKLEQNPQVRSALESTKGLELLPDHHTRADDPPAWRYFEIWQGMRDGLATGQN